MSKSLDDRTLALAGIFMAVNLVQQIARKGMADTKQMEDALRSLFVSDPQTTLEVYGGKAQIEAGLRALILNLTQSEGQNVELLRYVITLLHLERRLAKRKDLLNTIEQGLAQAQQQMEHFPLMHANILARLADTYSHTLSTLSPRVMVQGDGGFLNQPDNVNKVRALLLAAVRSTVLWRQSGGSRWQFILRRKTFVEAAKRLLNDLPD